MGMDRPRFVSCDSSSSSTRAVSATSDDSMDNDLWIEEASMYVTSGSTEEVLIFFDWDDTLLPTSYISAEVKPRLVGCCPQVPFESPVYSQLHQHALEIVSTLRAARAIGR